MTKRFVYAIGEPFLFALIAFGGWWSLYPSRIDPRNPLYVLWKHGLAREDLSIATAAMIGDPGRDRIVVGRTAAQLQRRFGTLLPPSDAPAYLRDCYLSSPWKNSFVRFIPDSSWMIVFDGDVATKLVLVKGC
jgi:hypothetical protein